MTATLATSSTPDQSAARLAGGRIPDPPYTGIRPFQQNEWPIFFGREAIVEELLRRLSRDRFVAVVGASGGGKSSVVKAGLFATLKHKHARLGVAWETASMRPAGSPMWSLAETLCRITTQRDKASDQQLPADLVEPFRGALARGSGAIAAVLREWEFPASQNLLLLVDQFEELFRYDTLGGEAEIEMFLDQLMDVVNNPPEGFYLVLTMRSDFLGDCARFPRFANALNQSGYLLRRMTDDELSDAIVTPAELLGGRVEEDLIQRLLRDAKGEPDHLPLLQHAMTWLWIRERRQNAAAGTPDAAVVLDSADYLAVSRMSGALSQHLNSIYDELGGAGSLAERRSLQVAAKRMFQALVEIGEHGRATRRPVRLGQLSEESGAALELLTDVIDAFRAPGRSFLLPPPPQPLEKSTVIDISHEALIRQWDKFSAPQGWLWEEQKDAETWGQLRSRTLTFIGNHDRLLDPYEIKEFGDFWRRKQPSNAWLRRYPRGDPPDSEDEEKQVTDLLDASRRRERIRIIRRSVLVLVAICFVLVILVMSVMYGRSRLETAKAQATAKASSAEVAAAKAEADAAKAREQASLAEAATAQARAQASLAEAATAKAEADAAKAREQASLAEAATSSAELQLLRQRQLDKINLAQASGALQSAKQEVVRNREQYREITEAQTSIDKLAQDLVQPEKQTGDDSPSPRVYIQIADPSQRATANDFRAKLGEVEIGNARVIIPGVELVKSYNAKSVVRCFRRAECDTDGAVLTADINKLLVSPVLTLQDLSGRYEQSAAIRPRHFEVWFGPGPIALRTGP